MPSNHSGPTWWYTVFLREALTLKEFEPQSTWDWFRIPFYLVRWVTAYIWTYLWAWSRLRAIPKDDPWRFGMAFGWGRHESPEPTICPRCLWAGPQRWLYHGYGTGWDGDSEPRDECPRCGKEL